MTAGSGEEEIKYSDLPEYVGISLPCKYCKKRFEFGSVIFAEERFVRKENYPDIESRAIDDTDRLFCKEKGKMCVYWWHFETGQEIDKFTSAKYKPRG